MSDSAARERAARGYDENLVVVAGAGSGKTSLLVERLLCQMVERDLAAEDFAAITFTEKAAAEMRRRLEAALIRLVGRAESRVEGAPEPKSEADRAFLWLRDRVSPAEISERATARLRALAETEVTTIHGFCARLLRRYPLESGVDPDFRVDAGARLEELVGELWERFLSGPSGAEGAPRERFARVLARLGIGELESLARHAATFALPSAALERGLPDARATLGPWVRARLAAIESRVGPSPAKGPESWLAVARGTLEALRDSGVEAFREALAAARYEGARGVRGLLDGSAPTSAKHPEATELAEELHERLSKLRTVDDALLGDALALVRPFADEVRAEARRRGLLPFDALLRLTRDLLASSARVRREVARRYRVLFLDEFQDTDPLQYEIVFLIARDSDGPPPPGSLFIVGDPKQAIYRFRGADVAAYEAAVGRILDAGGARLVLTANFRSVPEIVAPLDRLFRRTFEPPAGLDESLAAGYVEYDGLSAARPPAGEPRVERWQIGAGAGARESRALEAEVIAGWVTAQAAAGRLAFRDVALLFRALTDAHVYVRALQRRGITVWVGRADEPDREPAFQQVTALLRALANPADAPAVLGFLRSPLGGVPDAELARHTTRNRGAWLYTTSTPDAVSVPNLARAFSTLARWHARAGREPMAELLAALRDETPLLALHASARDGARRRIELSALFERLSARAAAAPDRDLGALVSALVREEQRRSAEEPIPDANAVRVLSIHAAKGLEFPVVILPDLTRFPPHELGDELGVDLRHSREHNALAVHTRAARSSTWLERERLEKSCADAELRRVLYVAATRAQERLIVAESKRMRRPDPRSFAGLLDGWPEDPAVRQLVLLEASSDAADAPAESASGALAALQHTAFAAEIARDSAHPPFARPSGLSEEEEEHAHARSDDDEPLPPRAAAAREVARAAGNSLHELLERWDFRDPERARALLRSAVGRAARDSAASASEIAADAGRILESLLASPLPAALASVEVLGRELPLLFREADGRAWSGTLDLLYRDSDGRLVVADYKTDRAPSAEARGRYRAQLAVYARGVAQLFPGESPPALELLWLRTGQRERLPLESPP
ncbi:MAG: UvrD-helicase domain-containing protein [Myxococcota bacterium]